MREIDPPEVVRYSEHRQMARRENYSGSPVVILCHRIVTKLWLCLGPYCDGKSTQWGARLPFCGSDMGI